MNTFTKLKLLLLVPIIISLVGCSTMKKSLLLGTTIGGVTGGAIGANHGNSGTGAAVGALAGLGISYLVHKEKEKRAKSAESTPEKLELDDADSPFLKSPKVRKFWQDDKIEGHKFIKGHWIYEIQEESVWMQ